MTDCHHDWKQGLIEHEYHCRLCMLPFTFSHYEGTRTKLVLTQGLVDGLLENVRTLEAEKAKLREALRVYAEYHGPTADHHRDDCPTSRGCERCRVDAIINEFCAAASSTRKPAMGKPKLPKRIWLSIWPIGFRFYTNWRHAGNWEELYTYELRQPKRRRKARRK